MNYDEMLDMLMQIRDEIKEADDLGLPFKRLLEIGKEFGFTYYQALPELLHKFMVVDIIRKGHCVYYRLRDEKQ